MEAQPEAPVHSYDVVLVGAGPAGSMCALALKDTPLRVAVLDKSPFPRDKVCGDAISGVVPRLLATVAPDLADAFRRFERKNQVASCRIVSPDGHACEVRFSGPGFMSPRIDFDDFLLQQARMRTSADFYLGTAVRDVAVRNTHVETTAADGTLFRSQLVIGCDGAHSVVARRLTETRVDNDHYSGAVRAYYRNVADVRPDRFEVYLPKAYLPGYFWIFPLPGDRVNVGFGMLSRAISERSVSLKHGLAHLIEEDPELAPRFREAEPLGTVRGFGLPLGSRRVPVSGDRFLLTGDAAALIDPITGEGIANAMESGRLAAEQAVRCFAEGDFSAAALQPYADALYEKLGKPLQRKHLLQRLVGDRAWLLDLAVGQAASNPVVRKLIHRSI